MNPELNADLRNKITLPRTVLEFLKDGKDVPKKTIELALKDLNEAVGLVSKKET